MPHQTLARGHAANLGPNIVRGDLHINGVATPYDISINGAAPVAHLAAVSAIDTYHINGQSVTVTNTTAAAGPPNLTLSW